MRMTAAGFAVLLTLGTVPPVSSQVAIGVRAGASVADLSVDVGGFSPDLDSRTGLLVGAFADVPLTPTLSFHPGLQYAQKGAGSTTQLEGEPLGITLGVDYAEVPLLLRYAFPTEGAVGVHVFGGPAVAFEVACDVTLETQEAEVKVGCDQAEQEDVEVATKSFDIGALVGGGISVPAGPGSLLFELGYNFGLADVDEAAGGGSTKNRALYLTAGLAFPVG